LCSAARCSPPRDRGEVELLAACGEEYQRYRDRVATLVPALGASWPRGTVAADWGAAWLDGAYLWLLAGSLVVPTPIGEVVAFAETFLKALSYLWARLGLRGCPASIQKTGAAASGKSAKEGVSMNDCTLRLPAIATSLGVALLATGLLAVAINGAQNTASSAQETPGATTQTTSSTSKERWLHVRVDNQESKDETLKVNVPLELAEKILPTINKDRLHRGKVKMDDMDCHGVDMQALVDAIRSSKDGEFVTVQDHDSDVRVAKQNNYLLVHVIDRKHGSKKSNVDVKVPMKVVDALFSGSKDELDLVAGLHALSLQGDTELVTVKDEENNVRIWLDSKNSSD
jgi:hypothetical protein